MGRVSHNMRPDPNLPRLLTIASFIIALRFINWSHRSKDYWSVTRRYIRFKWIRGLLHLEFTTFLFSAKRSIQLTVVHNYNMKTVHKLSLVLVNPFYLHVKNGVHIDVNAILSLDVICKSDLVLLQMHMVTLILAFNPLMKELANQLMHERLTEEWFWRRANARNISLKIFRAANLRYKLSW